jgi:hypothetical protein
MRLARTTLDLSGAQSAQLQFQMQLSSEQGYDHVIVEAHTPGQDDWTTLPTAAGSELSSSTTPPSQCQPNGFLLNLHPFLRHYLGGPGCTGPGTSGRWNSFTGTTDGWQDVAIDLSGYAGRQVELSISYVTDPVTGGVGAFVDDTSVVVDGVTYALGGDVIVAFDGDPIRRVEDLFAQLRQRRPGQRVELTVVRDGEEQKLEATLGERPEE